MNKFEQTKGLAEQGDAEAQNHLGVMYRYGLDVEQNDTEAVRWHTKSAEQGYANAQYYMGWMYEHGLCVEQNKETAILWYEKAAKQGHKSAAIFLHELKLENKN